MYTNDVTIITKLNPNETVIGDHKLLTFEVDEKKVTPEKSLRRNWKKYNKEELLAQLSNLRLDLKIKHVCHQFLQYFILYKL